MPNAAANTIVPQSNRWVNQSGEPTASITQ